MLSKKIASLLCEQIEHELESAYMYLEIADYFQWQGLEGFASWYKVQAREEIDHARRFYDYLHQNNERAVFYSLEPRGIVFENYKKPLEESLKQEEFITSCINKIYNQAESEKDYRTKKFLNWFISEQQEEEENAHDNLDKIDMFGSNAAGLYLLDREMAKRCCN